MLVQLGRNGSDPGGSQMSAAGMETELEAAASLEHTDPASQPEAEAAAFQWKQLDSPDFVTYVANLRRIGCPEATIRDIVDGELREIYVQRANGQGGATGSVYASMSDAAAT